MTAPVVSAVLLLCLPWAHWTIALFHSSLFFFALFKYPVLNSSFGTTVLWTESIPLLGFSINSSSFGLHLLAAAKFVFYRESDVFFSPAGVFPLYKAHISVTLEYSGHVLNEASSLAVRLISDPSLASRTLSFAHYWVVASLFFLSLSF